MILNVILAYNMNNRETESKVQFSSAPRGGASGFHTFSRTPSAAWRQSQQHVQILQMTAVHVSLATIFSAKM